MEIPENFLFELLGRQTARSALLARQVTELNESLSRARTSEATWRERAELAVQPDDAEPGDG